MRNRTLAACDVNRFALLDVGCGNGKAGLDFQLANLVQRLANLFRRTWLRVFEIACGIARILFERLQLRLHAPLLFCDLVFFVQRQPAFQAIEFVLPDQYTANCILDAVFERFLLLVARILA